MFQVFQLMKLVIRGLATPGDEFIISVDCVANEEKEVRGVLLCLQDFVWSPHFKQRKNS